VGIVSIPVGVQATVDLGPAKYQESLRHFRTLLETESAFPYLRIAVKTPRSEFVELQVRHSDAYVIGFYGADRWYSFSDQKGGWGTNCGIGSNYNHLGKVGKVTYDDLKNLGQISQFKNGSALDKRLIAIIILCTSEAARFATVCTYMTGLTNSVGTDLSPYLQLSGGIDFEYLKETYLQYWANPPEENLEPGKLYHFTRSDILLPHKK
jgi:hypothetical protein